MAIALLRVNPSGLKVFATVWNPDSGYIERHRMMQSRRQLPYLLTQSTKIERCSCFRCHRIDGKKINFETSKLTVQLKNERSR